MHTKNLTQLLHPVFLTGLFLLLLNDHYLKDAYGNWWTGKLSDVAGVLFLPLLWKAVFGGSNRTAILVTIGFFSWWKLPVSQSVIDGANVLTGLSFSRVVDATDLLAFAVLPLSWWALRNPVSINFAPARRRQLLINGILLPLTAFALFATSTDDDLFLSDGSITSCCSDVPQEILVDSGRIFLPTAFSPDFDGINDVFQLLADGNNLRVDTFRVFTQLPDSLVYEAVDVTDFEPLNGFDGVVNDTIEPRQFRYEVLVTANGTRARYVGLVCSLPCSQPSGLPEPTELSNCVYGTQFVAGSGFNRELSNLEDREDCFE